MKKVKAYLGHLRISPRKVRLVADSIRGLPLHRAESKLKFIPKASALPMLKLLRSAKNNAVNQGLDESHLFVEVLRVDQGRTLKRYLPRARGQATLLRKKSSHITLILGEHK